MPAFCALGMHAAQAMQLRHRKASAGPEQAGALDVAHLNVPASRACRNRLHLLMQCMPPFVTGLLRAFLCLQGEPLIVQLGWAATAGAPRRVPLILNGWCTAAAAAQRCLRPARVSRGRFRHTCSPPGLHWVSPGAPHPAAALPRPHPLLPPPAPCCCSDVLLFAVACGVGPLRPLSSPSGARQLRPCGVVAAAALHRQEPHPACRCAQRGLQRLPPGPAADVFTEKTSNNSFFPRCGLFQFNRSRVSVPIACFCSLQDVDWD